MTVWKKKQSQSKKEGQIYKIITINLIEKDDKSIVYRIDDINPILSYHIVIEGLAIALEEVVKQAKEKGVHIPEELVNFKLK
ncbi:hypothetical protein HOE07_04235 [archaeon]|jgi:hypothetical protein|nr:hypothetical protein [archaeon]